jgi:hypothetical protein
MKPSALSVLIFMIGVLVPSVTHAWWADGHQLIAAIAYQQLTATEQARVDTILAQHPNIATWSSGGASHLEIFMKASTWADEIRNYNDPSTHADWHFIDYKLKPTTYPTLADLKPTDNVVVGITQLTGWLDDPHVTPPEQAKNLAFLIHFVGDIHQPLHCECLFNSTFPATTYPDGDRGGNRFMVYTNATMTHKTKLHSLWDGLLGDGEALTDIEARVGSLMTAHPRSDFSAQLAKTDPNDWSLESRALAISTGYKPLPALNGTTSHPVTLPANYMSQAQSLSEKQAALAGYRLADKIKAIIAANP